MVKNLDSADRLTKLTLSVATIFSYAFGVITGPLAKWLAILSLIVILVTVVKMVARENK